MTRIARRLIAAAASAALTMSSVLPAAAAGRIPIPPLPEARIAALQPLFRPQTDESLVRRVDLDAGEVMAGLVTLGILAAILNDRDERRGGYAHVAPRHPAPSPHLRPAWPVHPPAHRPHRPVAKVLPAACLRNFDLQGRHVPILGERCLNRSYAHANALPRRCQITVNTRHGLHRGYAGGCLRNHGYSLAGR